MVSAALGDKEAGRHKLASRFGEVVMVKVCIGMGIMINSFTAETMVMHQMYQRFNSRDLETVINNIPLISQDELIRLRDERRLSRGSIMDLDESTVTYSVYQTPKQIKARQAKEARAKRDKQEKADKEELQMNVSANKLYLLSIIFKL